MGPRTAIDIHPGVVGGDKPTREIHDTAGLVHLYT